MTERSGSGAHDADPPPEVDALIAGGPEADPQGIAAAREGGPGPASISPELRGILASLANELIPSAAGMPSASEAGVAGAGLDELLTSRPDLVDGLVHVLEAARGTDSADVLARLAGAPDGTHMAVLATVVPGAYYLNPQIRARIGYGGQRALPIPDPPLDDEDEALLRSVRDRGPVYRA